MRAAVGESNHQSSDTDIHVKNITTQQQISKNNAVRECPSLQRAVMEDIVETGSISGCDAPEIDHLFTAWPPLQDELKTETSELQDDTVRECLPFLKGSTGPLFDHTEHGLPSLARDKHIHFLRGSLEAMPAAFVRFDASRPWIIYWALTALRLLGEDVEEYRERYCIP
ncbi:MAG: hypothetical protein Q9188_005782 [Gyalolechia gomerana]